MTPQDVSNAAIRLSVGRLLARKAMPYFRSGILGMVYVEVSPLIVNGRRAPCAVTPNFIFAYDPEIIVLFTDQEIAAIVIHEFLHPLNKHFERGAGHPPAKVNVAGDLAINQLIRTAKMTLPEGCLFPEKWNPPLPPDLGIEGYLALLPDDTQAPDDGAGDGKGDGEGDPSKRKIVGVGRGHCGSGAGNKTQGEPDPGEGEKEGDGSGNNIPKNLGRSPVECENIRRQVAEDITKEAAKGRGTVPDGLVRWAGEVLKPPKIPWEQKLRALCRHAIAYRPGAVDFRYTAISRRQAGVGFGPGRPVLPALRAPVPNVAFLVDTSGSMGADELRRALSEARGVMTAVGAAITFLVCDAAVHGIQRVTDYRILPSLLKGGGGTDMIPAFAEIEKLRPRPEIVICVTDGLVGPGIPARPPAGINTIFVLTGPGHRRPCGWGHHIEVDE